VSDDDKSVQNDGESSSQVKLKNSAVPAKVASNDCRQKHDRLLCVKRAHNRRFAKRLLRSGLVLVAFSQDHPVDVSTHAREGRFDAADIYIAIVPESSVDNSTSLQ